MYLVVFSWGRGISLLKCGPFSKITYREKSALSENTKEKEAR